MKLKNYINTRLKKIIQLEICTTKNRKDMKPTIREEKIFDLLSEAFPDKLGLQEVIINGKSGFCIVFMDEQEDGTELIPLSIIVNEEIMKDVIVADDIRLLKLNKEVTKNILFENFNQLRNN